MPAPTYLISRTFDPFFALFIGLSAAATRINREEKELGRSTGETVDAGIRYVFFYILLQARDGARREWKGWICANMYRAVFRRFKGQFGFRGKVEEQEVKKT